MMRYGADRQAQQAQWEWVREQHASIAAPSRRRPDYRLIAVRRQQAAWQHSIEVGFLVCRSTDAAVLAPKWRERSRHAGNIEVLLICRRVQMDLYLDLRPARLCFTDAGAGRVRDFLMWDHESPGCPCTCDGNPELGTVIVRHWAGPEFGELLTRVLISDVLPRCTRPVGEPDPRPDQEPGDQEPEDQEREGGPTRASVISIESARGVHGRGA